jgi:hypothetical protein
MMKDNKESELFPRSDSENIGNSLMNRFNHPPSITYNAFVDEADVTDEGISPLPKIVTRSGSARKLKDLLTKTDSFTALLDFKKPSMPEKVEPVISPKKVAKVASPVAEELKEEEEEVLKPLKKSETTTKKPTKKGRKPVKGKRKKRKRRRDVIFKTILRECRRYFQIQLTDLTGFISSKKPRTDEYMYKCMEKFNKQTLGMTGTFEENFYLS